MQVTGPQVPAAPLALTVDEVANRLSVSRRKVWSLISGGQLEAIKLGPRTTRVLNSALNEFIARCPIRA